MSETVKKAQDDYARFQAAAEQWRKDFERWERERRALIDRVLTEEPS
jgi:hypothetical protein